MQNAQNDTAMKTRMFVMKTAHYFLTILLFYGCWMLFRYNELPTSAGIGFRYNYLISLACLLLLAFFNRVYNAYLFGYCRIRTLALAQFVSQFFSVGIIYFSVSVGWNHFRSPLPFLLLLMAYALDCAASYVGNGLYFRLNRQRRTLLIYRDERDRRRFGSIQGKPMERLYHIDREIEFDGTFSEIVSELTGYDAIFVAGVNSHCRNGILKETLNNSAISS